MIALSRGIAMALLWACALSAAAATVDVPTSIPHDYSRDVTQDLQDFIKSVPDAVQFCGGVELAHRFTFDPRLRRGNQAHFGFSDRIHCGS